MVTNVIVVYNPLGYLCYMLYANNTILPSKGSTSNGIVGLLIVYLLKKKAKERRQHKIILLIYKYLKISIVGVLQMPKSEVYCQDL